MITKAHQDKVNGYITGAETDGATIVVDGRNPQVAGYDNGYFVGGTLIDNVTPDMVSYKEEFRSCISSCTCEYDARSNGAN